MDLSEVSPVAICLFGGPLQLTGTSRTRRVCVETGDGNVGASADLPPELADRPWVYFDDSNGAGPTIIELRKTMENRIRMALENPSGFNFRSKSDGGQLVVDAIARALHDAENQRYHGAPSSIQAQRDEPPPPSKVDTALDEYRASSAHAYFENRASSGSSFGRRTDFDWKSNGSGGRNVGAASTNDGWGEPLDNRGGGSNGGWGGVSSALGGSSRADTDRWR